MAKLMAFCRWIDRANEFTGKTVAWLVIPLAFIVVLEAIMRYVFDSPTLWAWDTNMYLGGLMCIFAGGYGLLHSSHVWVDVFVENLSPRRKALVELLTAPLFLFAIGVLIWQGTLQARHAVHIREHWTSLWEPAIYPLRVAIPIGASLFFLQGVSKFIKDLNVLLGTFKEGGN